MINPEAQAVIDAIYKAFANVKRGEVTLHEADVIDDYGSDEERQRARKLDTETHWKEVPHRDIEKYDWVLSFLDDISWRYYIAAYMTWAVEYVDRHQEWDTNSVSSTIYTFAHDSLLKDRFEILNRQQSTCVCMFLRYMDKRLDSSDSSIYLEAYWDQFAQHDF